MPWRKTPAWITFGGAWLSLGAGYINAVGFLGAQQHGLTHVTGQVTRIGIELSKADFRGTFYAALLGSEDEALIRRLISDVSPPPLHGVDRGDAGVDRVHARGGDEDVRRLHPGEERRERGADRRERGGAVRGGGTGEPGFRLTRGDERARVLDHLGEAQRGVA